MENEQLSEKELKFGYWFVNNKLKLKNILLIVLFFSNLILWGYIVYVLVTSFGSSYWKDQQIVTDISNDRFTNLEDSIETTKPQNIRIVNIDTYSSYDSRMDLVALISNPNKNWTAEFIYKFNTSVNDTIERKGFIMPGEQKYLIDLDVKSGSVLGLDVVDVKWSRYNKFSEFVATRNLFEITDVKYLPKNTQDNDSLSNLAKFNIKNNSNYNYYQPNFQIFLKNGSSVVAVSNITIDKLLSGQTRDISVGWLESILSVKSVEVVPDINYISSDSYIPF